MEIARWAQQKTSVDVQARTEGFLKLQETTNDHTIKKNASISSLLNRTFIYPLIEPATSIIHDSCMAEKTTRNVKKKSPLAMTYSPRRSPSKYHRR
jgi:hypothetical protein